MITSMTAFSRLESSNELGDLSWELRSVNHRYLDVGVRLPEQLRFLEPAIRNKISEKLSRGKVEAILNFNATRTASNQLSINHDQVRQLLKICNEINNFDVAVPLTCNDILKWPGVVETIQIDLKLLEKPILNLLEKGLDQLIEMRSREGTALATQILQKLEHFAQQFKEMQEKMPIIIKSVRDKLKERIAELQIDLDMSRFEHELILLVHKYDVTEEIDRIQTHLNEVRRIITQGGVIGRKLDFFMQELNREANTLGSKAIDKELTNYVVEFKVLIEQIREQSQNLE
jgi:uncharacterized protein (TIGR00255 family)